MGYYAPVLWTYKWSKEETYVVGVAKANVEIRNVEIRNVEIINVEIINYKCRDYKCRDYKCYLCFFFHKYFHDKLKKLYMN